MIRASLVGLLAAIAVSPLAAADTLIPIPEGFAARPPVVAVRGDRIAVAFQKEGSSRIVQVRGAEVYGTDLPGNAWRLEYSTGGEHLLVGQSLSGSDGFGRTTLLDTHGGTIFAIDHDPALSSAAFFSTTGETIGTRRKTAIDVYDLHGKRVRELDLGRVYDLVLVLGDGNRVVVGTERSLFGIDLEGPSEAWRLSFDGRQQWIRALEGNRFAAGGEGAFRVIDPDGRVIFARGYEGFLPSSGPTPSTLYVFDRNAKLLLVDIEERRHVEIDANLEPPAGYDLGFTIHDGNLILTSETHVLVRSFGVE